MSQTTPPTESATGRWYLLGFLLLFGGATLYFSLNQPKENAPPPKKSDEIVDPRVSYSGPFRNLHPDVKEVGGTICATCHLEICQSFRQHPMGQSMLPISKVLNSLALDANGKTTFTIAGVDYSTRRDGDRWFHLESRKDAAGNLLYEREMEVQYAVGSGQKGFSFLGVREGGYLFQTWISWYTQQQKWDLSPGFNREVWSFQARPVAGECLFCHANRFDQVPGSLNHLNEPLFRGHAISCERCHGPGELHVREREADPNFKGTDYTIVNPRHLPLDERESICQQCHLEGEARILHRGLTWEHFRPGLKLDAVMNTFTTDHGGTDRKAVNHVEQMYLSKCFQKSEGRMGCTTCHDPHRQIPEANRLAYHIANCKKCHDDCTLPKPKRIELQPDDSCIACHMPRFATKDIVHTATSNHQITRHKPTSSYGHAAHNVPVFDLLLFPRNIVDEKNPLLVRNRALAASKARHARISPLETLQQLQKAVKLQPDDHELWQAIGRTQQIVGTAPQVLEAHEQVLSLMPDHEISLYDASLAAGQMNRYDLAKKYLARCLELNPWLWHMQAYMAKLLLNQGEIDAAKPHLDRWLMLHPDDPEVHYFLAEYHWRSGDRPAAEKAFASVDPLANARQKNDLQRRWIQLKGKR